MIITLEEHFTTAAFLKATAKQMPDAAHSAKLEERLLDLGAGRIAAMDAEGVDLQVLPVAAPGQEKLDASTATALVREARRMTTGRYKWVLTGSCTQSTILIVRMLQVRNFSNASRFT